MDVSPNIGHSTGPEGTLIIEIGWLPRPAGHGRLGELTNVCFGAVKFKKSVFGRPTALEKAGWPEWARCCRSPLVRAVVRLEGSVNVGNLADSSQSLSVSPPAVMAEIQPSALSFRAVD